VALPIQVLARGLAHLLPQLALLFLDPGQPGDDIGADDVKAHARRGRDADVAPGRVDAEVDVLDVLQDDLCLDLGELETGHRSRPDPPAPGGAPTPQPPPSFLPWGPVSPRPCEGEGGKKALPRVRHGEAAQPMMSAQPIFAPRSGPVLGDGKR